MEAIKRRSRQPTVADFSPDERVATTGHLRAAGGLAAAQGRRRYGAFQDPAFRGVRVLLGLFRDGLAPALSNTEIANLYQEFARGTIAMYITGPWHIGEFTHRLPPDMQDTWATAPLPGMAGPGVSIAGGSSLVVFKRLAAPDGGVGADRVPLAPGRPAPLLSISPVISPRERMRGRTPRSPAIATRPRSRAAPARRPTPKVPEWEQIATQDHRAR